MSFKKRCGVFAIGLSAFLILRLKFFGLGVKLDPYFQKYLFLNLTTCINWLILAPSLFYLFFPKKIKKHYFPVMGIYWITLFVTQTLFFKLSIPVYQTAIDSTYLLPAVGALSLLPTSRRFKFILLIPYVILILANGLYSRVFLKPLAFSDFRLLTDYMSIWSVLTKAVVYSCTIASLIFVSYLWKKQNRTFWIELPTFFLIWLMFFLLPYLPLKKNEFRASSPLEHLKQNGYLNVLHVQPRIENFHPRRRQIEAATAALGYPPLSKLSINAKSSKRNLYVILVESFADLSSFENIRISPSPFDPRFMKAWNIANKSSVLSPVFAGRTAQSEFEVACGVASNLVPGMAFTDYVRDDLKCLPSILSQLGYSTGMTHGFEPEIFQSNFAYPHLGFQTIITRENYGIPSTQLVPDSLMYSKVKETSFWGVKTPRAFFFNTSLTHTPYEPMASDSAIPITVESKDLEATVFAKRAFEASRLLMNFIESIQSTDPEALIVAYGDHLPPLPSFWKDIFHGEQTPIRFLRQHSTPILMIDGKRGPISIQNTPLYFLSYIILNKLGFSNLSTDHFEFARPVDGWILKKETDSDKWRLEGLDGVIAQSLKTRFFQVLQE